MLPLEAAASLTLSWKSTVHELESSTLQRRPGGPERVEKQFRRTSPRTFLRILQKGLLLRRFRSERPRNGSDQGPTSSFSQVATTEPHRGPIRVNKKRQRALGKGP